MTQISKRGWYIPVLRNNTDNIFKSAKIRVVYIRFIRVQILI